MVPIRLTAPKKQGRYGENKRVTVDGQKFDSAGEAKRYSALVLLQRAGRITDLQRQVRYELAPSVKHAGEKRARPALTYWADFTYIEGGALVVEDVKVGGLMTEVFKIKRHLMLSVHGIDIRITKK